MAYEVLVLDVDGTLVNSKKRNNKSYQRGGYTVPAKRH